jgi:hypothetical protein
MSEKESSRRNFLKIVGLSAGASLVNANVLGGIISENDIKRLNPKQQEFMMRYGSWMDEFIDVIRIQKSDPGNLDNQKKMIALTLRAEEFKPELSVFMKDETFLFVYQASIERMKKEI